MEKDSPGKWAMRLIEREGAESAKGLARAWINSLEDQTVPTDNPTLHDQAILKWKARLNAITVIEALK